MKFFRDHGLTITLLIFTVLCIGGMVVSGVKFENEMLAIHRQPPMGVTAYVASSSFLSALFENWESEFLQMAAYVMLTATLFQRGSAESRDPDTPERDGDEAPHHWRWCHPSLRWLYAHSLGLALTALFFACVAHWLSSAAAANRDATLHGRETKTALAHLGEAGFWFESFQNWQSEFLSTAVLVVLSIFLRFRNSPESKPVSAADNQTGG